MCRRVLANLEEGEVALPDDMEEVLYTVLDAGAPELTVLFYRAPGRPEIVYAGERAKLPVQGT
jgi:hypothetical protein